MDKEFFVVIVRLIEKLNKTLGDEIALSFYLDKFMGNMIVIRVRMIDKNFVIEQKVDLLQLDLKRFTDDDFLNLFVETCKRQFIIHGGK